MEIIELMSCTGCGRIIDQICMPKQCKCGVRFFKAVGPDWIILFKWFINNPKHVVKLIIKDIKEKLHD